MQLLFLRILIRLILCDYVVSLQIRIPLKVTGLRSRDLSVEIQKTAIRAGLKNAPTGPILAGQLQHEIKLEESTWVIEDKNTLLITLEKVL